MIWESASWKADLQRRANELRSRRVQKRWPEPALARIERELMIGFYAIRKLAESGKLSDSTVSRPVKLECFRPTGKRITRMNWHRIEELFDFSETLEAMRALLDVCHQFVHSYIFVVDFTEDGFIAGIFLASDRQRTNRLLRISIDAIIELFEVVGQDYPNYVTKRLDPKTGKYKVISEMLRGPVEGQPGVTWAT